MRSFEIAGHGLAAVTAALAVVVLAAAGPAAAKPPYPTVGTIHRDDPAINELLPGDAEIQILAKGFQWSEGPVWVPPGLWGDDEQGFLVFSDVPANIAYRWSEKGGLEPFIKPSGFTGVGPYSREPGSNGLALDADGNLLSCEHGDRRVSRMEWGKGKVTLAGHHEGGRFNSPNDLAVHSSGAIYFTDPPYGLPGGADSDHRELDVFGTYLIRPDGEVALVAGDLRRPNGVALSADESIVYVAQSERPALIHAYPVLDDLTLGEPKVFADLTEQLGQGLPGGLDGLKIDVHENVWTTGPGGVWIFNREGTLLGRIETGHRTANLCFGGDDGTMLYLTIDHMIGRVQTLVRGAAVGVPGS